MNGADSRSPLEGPKRTQSPPPNPAPARTLAAAGWLDKSRTVAGRNFDRWLVPPAALCIHLCIGMAYGFSVFWLPLTRAIGIDRSIAAPAELSWLGKLTTTQYDWDKPILGWVYTLFFIFLGCSAAILGPWLERSGPRKAGVVAACCWCGGMLVSAIGIRWHQLWLVWLGSGVIGGIGLGLGYISPVSTLVKWFPDRRGMATGMAIMGFGGGAMIGSPLADRLMAYFAGPDSVGVWQTFVVLAILYFAFMMLGAMAYRIPREGWRPVADSGSLGTDASTTNPTPVQLADTATRFVPVDVAWRTPQFWLLWAVLCLNVSAGIGVIGMASPMLQEIFGGRLIGVDLPFESLDPQQARQVAAIGAGFTGLLSLFNIGGRFFWASLSDIIGRKLTYAIFFLLGGILYAAVPAINKGGAVSLFVAAFCLILTMYGGGFAAIPAYLADLFGNKMVGAIHGRLLTAWSVAGVLGPVLVNYWNDYQVRSGVPRAEAYHQTMLILAALLAVGFVCNLAVRPVADSLFKTWEPHPHEAASRPNALSTTDEATDRDASGGQRWLKRFAFWSIVALPLGWGVWVTLRQASVLLLGPA